MVTGQATARIWCLSCRSFSYEFGKILTVALNKVEAYTKAHKVECNTCKSEDPEAVAKAKESGYWLP